MTATNLDALDAETRMLWEEVQQHQLSSEDHARIDTFLAQQEADKILRQARAIYVCIRCHQTFHDGKPEACPKCGKEFRCPDLRST